MQCPTQTIEGIDVYSGTGTVDWAMVASSGRQFAFIKATQGNYDNQSMFATQWAGAGSAQVLRSPYHFFDGTIDGVTQANWFLAELNTVGGLKAGDLPPLLDIECPTSSTQSAAQSSCEYSGDSGWAPTATLQQRALDWLHTVETATGRTPIIYSYPSWFGDTGVTSSQLAAYPLFIASYATCANVPAPWTSAVFWQYSATGSVPGVPGQADEDRFIGSAGALMQLTQPPAVPIDAGVGGDAGIGGPHHAGCGCAAGATPGAALPLALAFAVVLRRRRRLVR